jgi:TPR repeat protein
MLKLIGAALIGICFLNFGLFYGSEWFGIPNWSFIPQYNFFVFGGTDYITYVGVSLGFFLFYLGDKNSEEVQDDDQKGLNDENSHVERHSWRSKIPNEVRNLEPIIDPQSEAGSKNKWLNPRNFIWATLWLIVIFSGASWDDVIDWKNSWSDSKQFRSAGSTVPSADHNRLIPLAKGGSADAQYNLGVIYENGTGVPQDYKTAMKWYRRAAEQGHSSAQNNLGSMYLSGKVLGENDARAHMWFNIAASLGDERGRKNKETIATIMNPEKISAAHKLARECVRKKYKGC